ncbi:MAG: type II secretion system major pseudopilin GspG [Verrucomicrobiota bacterium]|nr:type II secretion system major pseudopilin GspG [Verrucomicrobiota bacterium]
MKRTAAGFTLIELMVVVIIIAALAAMVLPRLIPATDSAKRKIARGDIAHIKIALQLYRLHNDRYPATEEGLDVLLVPAKTKDWNEPFLDTKPEDPWKRKYQYRFPGTHGAAGYDLWSLGADGKDGTEDDITNWQD